MKLKAFALDTALSCAVFVPLVFSINYFGIGLSLADAGWTALGSLGMNAATGGTFGRLLNAWRKKLGY
jgi:hypothetical protein